MGQNMVKGYSNIKMTHGIMFHHFYDNNKHIPGQGAITAQDFDDLLVYISEKNNILPAYEFMHRINNKSIKENDVCITFDDGLLCQYEVAYPVLKDRNLTAFWFIYTSPYDGRLEKLEIYRHFRSLVFNNNIEEFYQIFFGLVKKMFAKDMIILNESFTDEYLAGRPFYTKNDKLFRYLRNEILGDKYDLIMEQMMMEHNYDIELHKEKLWIKKHMVKTLYDEGNIIGLHSYSHPVCMNKNNYHDQLQEYEKNKNQLEEITMDNVFSVAYPCNSYNHDTIRCMRKLGVKVGFRAKMSGGFKYSQDLEYPREDHANIFREMRGIS